MNALDPTPRPAERALPKADGGDRPSSVLEATGRGKRARRHWPPAAAKPAPGRSTRTSPRGCGARPAPPRPAAHARALQPVVVSASKPRLARRARCPARLRPLGGAPLPPRAPTGGSLAPPAIQLPTLGARASYLRAGEG